jgi:hypothetical protein
VGAVSHGEHHEGEVVVVPDTLGAATEASVSEHGQGEAQAARVGRVGGCCKALTAQCLACASGVEVGRYCADRPDTVGCDKAARVDEPRVCCKAMLAQCQACFDGIDVHEYAAPSHFRLQTVDTSVNISTHLSP